MTRSQWQSKLRSLPKGLTLKQVARRLRKPYQLAARWCKVFGSRNRIDRAWTAQRLREFRRAPWSRVPWNMANVEIARSYGVSREIVRRRRKEFTKAGNGS